MYQDKPRLLDVKETAKYIGLSVAALRKRIYLRQIDGLLKIGRRLYFDRKKLDSFLDNAEIKIDRNGVKGK